MAASWSSRRRQTPETLHGTPACPHEPPTASLDTVLNDILADTAVRPVPLSVRDRRMIAGALDVAIALAEATGRPTTRHRLLMERVLDGLEPIIPPRDPGPQHERDLSRPQELAQDRIASEYGRCAARFQADGSVVLTGMTDDIERCTVCIDRDGRERWRS